MSDWVKREIISPARPITVSESSGRSTTLYTKTRTFYEFNTRTAEIRPPSSPTVANSSTPYTSSIIYTEIPKGAEGDRIFEQARTTHPANVIDDTRNSGRRYVAQADVISNGAGKAVTIQESGVWVGASIKNNIGNWKFGKTADWTNSSLSLANSTAITNAFNEAQAKGINGINAPQNIRGNLGLSRSQNPPAPTPQSSGDPTSNGDNGGGGNQQEPTGFNAPISSFDRNPINLGTSTGVISAKVDGKEVKSLRYPLTMITEGENQGYPKGQDYLKIGIRTYKPVGRTLIRGITGEFKNQISNATAHIILPIPSNIQDGNSVSYADGSLDGLTAAIADKSLNFMSQGGDGSTVQNAGQKFMESLTDLGSVFTGESGDVLKNLFLRGLAADAANLVGVGNITREQLLARESGGILNPNMELLFNGVSLRSFKFSFKLTPRDEDESKVIKAIIRVLKANMAPKIAGQGTFLKTPSVFDLAYMQGNRSHPFLHKFKTCALTDMSVNYTGEGIYATYSDATPVSMVMDLSFKELEPIYDVDYEENDNTVGY